MKRIISLLLVVSMLLGCILVFASCEPKDNGAEISVYLGESVYDFDPTAYYTDSNAELVMSLIWEPLFYVNENGKLENGVAKGYDVDEEEREIVIELRETYWSDSTRVTAADFVFAWRDLILEPNNANPAAALLYDIENAKEIKTGSKSIYDFGAVASGMYELTVKYREGADYMQLLRNLASVATSPAREDIINVYNQGFWSKAINTAVTNGAFKISDIDAASFTLARNAGYHQSPDVSNPTKIVVPNKLVTFASTEGDFAVSYNDIVEKTVFYIGDASLADRAANKANAIVADDLSTYTYVFNTENPLFANEKVRQALSLAIDRNVIVQAITFGKAATGFLPDAVLDTATGASFRKEALISASAKTAEAEALIASVDFAGLDKSFTLSVNDDEASLAIAALVETAWESLGFSVTVEALSTVKSKVKDFSSKTDMEILDSEIQATVIEASRGSRDFDVIAVDWQMYSTDAFVALAAFAAAYSGCGVDFEKDKILTSFGGWESTEYEALIDKAYTASSKVVRSEALHSAEQLLVESACIVPIVYNQTFAFVSTELSGVVFDGFGNVVFTKVKQKNYEDYLN